jgi:hypothetical protein
MLSWAAFDKVSPTLASDSGHFVPIRHGTASHPPPRSRTSLLAAVLDGSLAPAVMPSAPFSATLPAETNILE